MPIFTYKCKQCGAVFDFLQLRKNETPACEKCGSTEVEKQYCAFGVKGSSGKANAPCAPQGST